MEQRFIGSMSDSRIRRIQGKPITFYYAKKKCTKRHKRNRAPIAKLGTTGVSRGTKIIKLTH
jgi:hypothetical protein